MAVSAGAPFAKRARTVSTTTGDLTSMANPAAAAEKDSADDMPSKSSINTSVPGSTSEGNSPIEFVGDLNTNNDIPSREELKRIEDLSVLDRDGKLIPFKTIYTGSNVARRVLVIFIRHFFCGNCQEYVRTVTESISPESLLHLQVPTFIAIIGCGAPGLIPMYQAETNCPFPIYADPTRRLYDSLGMIRTLNLGTRPDYQRRGTIKGALQSIKQGIGALKGGKAFQAGDMHQVGGEFLFEPLNLATPICSPSDEPQDKQLGGFSGGNLGFEGEEKRVTWCHRMRNTRDHAEIPELREVLGLDGEGVPGNDRKRWMRAMKERKGTGLSTRTSTSTDPKGGSSGRQSSEKLMDATNMVRPI